MSEEPTTAHSPLPDRDLAGRALGDYQILRRLGRGGMANVYLAEQQSLRRQVAFKVLKNSLANDEAYVRRFHNEAQAAASLVHANIVQIHEVGCLDGVHFIAQEYVPGQNLKQWLARHGTADAVTAVHIMRQVIAALHRASQQGIIHRDIKPENIMLSKTGEVKVADFGLARVVSQGETVGLTQIGVAMGTPLYMSPEQVEGQPVDPRSDIYSFGVTCYEMLAGHPPFQGDTPLSVAVQHLRTEPERLEDIRPDLPAGLCRLIHKTLAKDPVDRYATPAHLMRDLRAVPVEGLDDWSSAGEHWDAPELLALADVHPELTERLESVMRTQALHIQQRRRYRRMVLLAVSLLLVGVSFGAAAAWLTRPADPLAIQTPVVAKKDSAYLQYWHAAYELNTEAALKSVAKYYPPTNPINRYYVRLAKQRLAELYRNQNQPQKARALYQELIELGGQEAQFAAAGYVGLANLLAQQGQLRDAQSKLAEAMPLLNGLPPDQQVVVVRQLDPNLRPEFARLARDFKNIQKLDGEQADRATP